MTKTYGRRGPRLSRIPAERAVQLYVLELTAALFLFFVVGGLRGGPLVCAVVMSLVGLWGIAVTARNRAAIRSVTGLKTQYVLAGPVTMFYSLVVHAWVGLAAGLAMALIALATKTLPPDQRTGRIEWSAGGER